MKIAGWIAVAVFCFSAVLQWNDPDPMVWIAAYLLAAAISAAASLGRSVRTAAGAAALLYAGAAIAVAPENLAASLPELIVPAMKTLEIEQARESLGLGICAAWLAVLAWRSGDGGEPHLS